MSSEAIYAGFLAVETGTANLHIFVLKIAGIHDNLDCQESDSSSVTVEVTVNEVTDDDEIY